MANGIITLEQFFKTSLDIDKVKAKLSKVMELSSTSATETETLRNGDPAPEPAVEAEAELTSGYFEEYASFHIHSIMLNDQVRTSTYRDAILRNKNLFKGRVVLDVGCGTGILSLFAAQAGASRVIGVDNSDIAHYAKQIVIDNGLADIVTIVQSKMEDLTELPGGIEHVDIIISEWMGYCLLNESMLDTVLFARDKWLIHGGLMFPDRVSLFICGIEDRFYKEHNIDCYKKIHGLKMDVISKWKFHRGHCSTIDQKMVVTTSCLLMEFDLLKLPNSDDNFAFTRNFHLECNRDDYISAFTTFFTVEFRASRKRVWFSTAPEAPYTHWMQTSFYLKDYATVKKGEIIEGSFSMCPSRWSRRCIEVTIKTKFDGELDTHEEGNTYYQL